MIEFSNGLTHVQSFSKWSPSVIQSLPITPAHIKHTHNSITIFMNLHRMGICVTLLLMAFGNNKFQNNYFNDHKSVPSLTVIIIKKVAIKFHTHN